MRLYENRKGNGMRNVKSKNCQTDEDVLLRVEGQKKRDKDKKKRYNGGKKMLFSYFVNKNRFAVAKCISGLYILLEIYNL